MSHPSGPKRRRLDHGVDEAESVEKSLELSGLFTGVENVGGSRVGEVAARQARAKALGRLICQLHPVLQDRDREPITRVATEPQPVLLVHLLRFLVAKHFLQLGHPASGQVAVLEVGPVP